MELKGITLKHFWIWYLLPKQRKTYKTDSLIGGNNVAKIRFLAMSFTERYGVYVDFFDSVGVIIEIKIKTNLRYNYGIHDKIEWLFYSQFFSDRNLARTAAIKKANELHNEFLNK